MVENNNISLSKAKKYKRILDGESPKKTRRLTVGKYKKNIIPKNLYKGLEFDLRY